MGGETRREEPQPNEMMLGPSSEVENRKLEIEEGGGEEYRQWRRRSGAGRDHCH